MTLPNGNIFRVTGGEFTVAGEFPAQRPETWRFDVFVDLRLSQQLSKQWRRASRRHRAHYDTTVMYSLWWPLWTGARHNYWTENTNHFTYPVMTMDDIYLALMLECHLSRFYHVFILVSLDLFDTIFKSGTRASVWLPKCLVTMLCLVFCWPAFSPIYVPSIIPKCDREWQCLLWTITVTYRT